MLRRFLILLLASPFPAAAQIVRGTITDTDARANVKAVTVTLLGARGERLYTVASDEYGRFEMVVPANRLVRLRAERIGYETVTSDLLIAHPGEILDVKVLMSTRAVELKPIDVIARTPIEARLRDFHNRVSRYQRPGIGRFWTRADLEKHPPALVSHLVGMIPTRPEVAISRDHLMCEGVTFYVDNVRLGVGDDDASVQEFDSVVLPEDVEGIEMYHYTDVPVELLPYMRRVNPLTAEDVISGNLERRISSFCMVVFVWRKPYRELYAGRTPKWRIALFLGAFAGLMFAERAMW